MATLTAEYPFTYNLDKSGFRYIRPVENAGEFIDLLEDKFPDMLFSVEGEHNGGAAMVLDKDAQLQWSYVVRPFVHARGQGIYCLIVDLVSGEFIANDED